MRSSRRPRPLTSPARPRGALAWGLAASLALLSAGCKRAEGPAAPQADAESGTLSSNLDEAYGVGDHAQESKQAGLERAYTPRPRLVCEHIMAMVLAEAGVTEPGDHDERVMAECEAELSAEAELRGPDNWNAIASCVLQAGNETELEACDRAHPMPSSAPSSPGGPGGPVVTGEHPRERQACDHMIQVIIDEATAETGQVPTVSSEERQQLSDDCVGSLIMHERPNRSPASYQQLLDCIGRATTGPQLQACE